MAVKTVDHISTYSQDSYLEHHYKGLDSCLCSQESPIGPNAQKSPMRGLVLCWYHFGILNKLIFELELCE